MVRVFSPDGALVRSFGDRGAGRRPRAFAIDPAGTLYLGTDRLRLFASDGMLLGTSAPRQRYS
jgi:hypothetical protein